jgi:hypothetical protein
MTSQEWFLLGLGVFWTGTAIFLWVTEYTFHTVSKLSDEAISNFEWGFDELENEDDAKN